MVVLKSNWEIEAIGQCCRIVAMVLAELRRAVRPGITTRQLEELAERIIRAQGARAAFRGYRGYPAALCVSVNEEVVHGIPSGRRLREGDLVSMDVGVERDGFYGDGAITVPVGQPSPEAQRLLTVAQEALRRGIEQARPGRRLHDISYAIQRCAEEAGFSVVRDFVGHGIGRELHEDPQVPNFGRPGTGPRLRPGMVLAIEPMVNVGTHEVRVLPDGWTVVTADGKPSVHFEHTVAITYDGPRVLTCCSSYESGQIVS